nr:MAG TPA: hypothetical protein [Caudoviricetes sp.]
MSLRAQRGYAKSWRGGESGAMLPRCCPLEQEAEQRKLGEKSYLPYSHYEDTASRVIVPMISGDIKRLRRPYD